MRGDRLKLKQILPHPLRHTCLLGALLIWLLQWERFGFGVSFLPNQDRNYKKPSVSSSRVEFKFFFYVCVCVCVPFPVWSKWATCVYWWVSADESLPIILHHQPYRAWLCGRVTICVWNCYFYHESWPESLRNIKRFWLRFLEHVRVKLTCNPAIVVYHLV